MNRGWKPLLRSRSYKSRSYEAAPTNPLLRPVGLIHSIHDPLMLLPQAVRQAVAEFIQILAD